MYEKKEKNLRTKIGQQDLIIKNLKVNLSKLE